MSEQGKRDNAEKLRWRNIPMFLLEPLIKVGQFGEKKYTTFNFLKGFPINDLLDCAKRHLSQFENPYEPDEDHESKQSHLCHAAWNLLIAAYVMKYLPQFDDRFKVEPAKVINLNTAKLREFSEQFEKENKDD